MRGTHKFRICWSYSHGQVSLIRTLSFDTVTKSLACQDRTPPLCRSIRTLAPLTLSNKLGHPAVPDGAWMVGSPASKHCPSRQNSILQPLVLNRHSAFGMEMARRRKSLVHALARARATNISALAAGESSPNCCLIGTAGVISALHTCPGSAPQLTNMGRKSRHSSTAGFEVRRH